MVGSLFVLASMVLFFLRDKIKEPFSGLFTQGMVCHETYKDKNNKWLSPEEVFSKETDIFIPAAREGTVTEENQSNLNAKIVCEGANGPLTSRADEELTKRGVLIIPDLYANAGGVAVSYFELVSNLSHMRFGRM